MAELFKVNAPVRKPLFEGVQGENEARSIQFDIETWVTELGDGAVTATAKRSQDSQPYPVTVTKVGNTVTWKPTSTDTAFAGVGSFQLEYTVDSVLAKTCIWSTMVAPSLDPAGDPPDPYDNWLAEMREIAADAIQAAQDADASADDAQAEVYEAEAWAKGTKNGTPVPSTAEQYENNAKYFAEESYKNAEAWAVGQRGGVDVPSTDPAYENNSKYWAGQAEDLKDATQAIVDEARADVFEAMDGLHEETTAGSALQLISDKYTENKEPYLFRKSIAGDRELDTVVGGTVAWNQLCNGDFSQSVSWNAINGSLALSSNIGSYTVTTIGQYAYSNSITQYLPSTVRGHKYLCVGYIKPSHSKPDVCFWINGGGSGSNQSIAPKSAEAGKWNQIAGIISCDRENGYFQFALNCTSANGYVVGDVDELKNVTCFDLTQMFGAAVADRIYAMEQANAGSGVALFRSWFPKEYYAYNTGELMSVKTTAHEMVGFNQWDEEWEVGTVNASTGALVANSGRIRSKNYVPVFPNTTYFHKTTAVVAGDIAYYDEDYNFISGSVNLIVNREFTTPENARYMKFSESTGYGNVYKSDVCINISDPARNGEYEPYTKHTYALDDIELRGVMKLDGTDIYFDGDTYEADGTVTRKYGIVDLGTLNWVYSVADTRFYTTGILVKSNADATNVVNAISDKYQITQYRFINGNYDNNMVAGAVTAGGTTYFAFKNTAYTTAADFKSAMSGVYLIYEKATPTTETADPYTNPQIVDAYGTERYVDERTVAVPVGHVTKYPDNLREKLDGLPWDFSTLIAPTEKAYKATRNYTAGSLLIVGNILYKVTANIANGGAITPNTNVTATTLSEVISAL